jgi:CubicO group peptidase (beta-lactamase class C family)
MKINYGKIDAKPEDEGYNPSAISRLNEHFEKLIDTKIIQSAGYLLALRGKIIAHVSMGSLTTDKKSDDFLPDSIRPIASITKVFTATAIFQLLEQGKIFLNQQVSTILKEFDNDMFKQINIFHLLTHTSGLKADPGSYFEPYPEDWDRGSWSKKNFIKKLLSGTLQYKTGTTWNYCSKAYTFLAEIVSRVSGMDYSDYVTENIIKPLGLNDTYYFVPENVRNRVCNISKWNNENIKRKKEDMISSSMKGGGGLWSTTYDLWKFGQMMANGGTFNGVRILGRKTVEAATKPQIKDFPAYNWRTNMFDEGYKWTCGLCWELKKHKFLPDETFDHEGSEGCGLYIDPKENFIFAGFYPSEKWFGESWVSPLAIAWSGII